MDFKQVKDYCKYVSKTPMCPATFKDCTSDNCPLCDKNLKHRQFESKINQIIERSAALIYSEVYDLKDYLKDVVKEFEQ